MFSPIPRLSIQIIIMYPLQLYKSLKSVHYYKLCEIRLRRFHFFLNFRGIDEQVSIFENKLSKNLFIEFEHWSIGKAILQRKENINYVIINNNFS